VKLFKKSKQIAVQVNVKVGLERFELTPSGDISPDLKDNPAKAFLTEVGFKDF
jgi:hypothetical protein